MALTEAQATTFLKSLKTPTRERRQRIPSLFDSEPAIKAAAKLLAEKPGDPVLWGALQVYVAGGKDPAPLAKLVTDKRTPVRITAAGGLLARGDKRGFAPLIAEIEAGGKADGAAWRAAAWHLVRWTAEATLGPPLDADAEQRAAAGGRWRAWWKANEAELRFRDGRWRTS